MLQTKFFIPTYRGIELPKYHKSWGTRPKNSQKMFTLNIMDIMHFWREGGVMYMIFVVVVISKGSQVGHEKPKSQKF